MLNQNKHEMLRLQLNFQIFYLVPVELHDILHPTDHIIMDMD